MLPLLLLFIAVPMIEIYFLIEVGGVIGAGWTVLSVIATAVVGSWMIKIQGMQTLFNLQKSAAQGEAPTQSLFDGACLLFAGILLLIPGFFTDAIGFILLVPPFRVVLLRYLQSKKSHIFRAQSNSNSHYSSHVFVERGEQTEKNDDRDTQRGRTIDVEDYQEMDNDKPQGPK